MLFMLFFLLGIINKKTFKLINFFLNAYSADQLSKYLLVKILFFT